MALLCALSDAVHSLFEFVVADPEQFVLVPQNCLPQLDLVIFDLDCCLFYRWLKFCAKQLYFLFFDGIGDSIELDFVRLPFRNFVHDFKLLRHIKGFKER